MDRVVFVLVPTRREGTVDGVIVVMRVVRDCRSGGEGGGEEK